MKLNADKASDSADDRDPESQQPESQQEVRRLPCRGCTSACGLYATCNGAPWRIGISAPSAEQGNV